MRMGSCSDIGKPVNHGVLQSVASCSSHVLLKLGRRNPPFSPIVQQPCCKIRNQTFSRLNLRQISHLLSQAPPPSGFRPG